METWPRCLILLTVLAILNGGVPAQPKAVSAALADDSGPPSSAAAPVPAAPAPAAPAPATPARVIDDFETEAGYHSEGERATAEVSVDNKLAHGGTSSLRSRYDVKPGGHASFGRSFEPVRDWRGSAGIAFWLRASDAGRSYTFMLFSGRPDAPTPFQAQFATTPDCVTGWRRFSFAWRDLKKAEWADANSLQAFDPARVTGIGISIGDADGRGNAGALWMDDITLDSLTPSDGR